MLSKVALSKVSLAAFASLHLATSAAWTVTNPKAEDESSPVSAPWVRFNPSQKVEVSLNSTASGTLSNKTTEPLEVDAKQTSLSLIEQLPPEVLLHIFSYFSLKELSQVALVSSYFKEVSKTAPSWKEMSFKLGIIDESFANTDLNYKAIVIAAFDRDFLNLILGEFFLKDFLPGYTSVTDCIKVNNYRFTRFCSFKNKRDLLEAVAAKLANFTGGLNKEELKNFNTIVRGLNEILLDKRDEEALARKIEGLASEQNGYEKNPKAARELNEALIVQGDKDAIIRKIEGLAYGRWGYEKKPKAVRELNETLIVQGDKDAIIRKIEGLACGRWGYEKNPKAARELNEALIVQGDKDAFVRKIKGLAFEQWGYSVDLEAARELNEALIVQGDKDAFARKIEGLGYIDFNFDSDEDSTEEVEIKTSGKYGYGYNPETARELNESLIAQGDEDAFARKVKGLTQGGYGYEKNEVAARGFNDALIEQGDQNAFARKIEGLAYGRYGYEENLATARELNDSFVAQADSEAILRKFTWLNSDSKTLRKNYIDCLEMALGFTDSLEMLSESPEKAYIDCLDGFVQHIKQLRMNPERYLPELE